MTKLNLYTPTDGHSITLDFKTLDGLKEALECPMYLSSRGKEELDNFMRLYTIGTIIATSIYNENVKLYKLEDGDIIAMNLTDLDCTTLSLTKPTSFTYHRYNTSFKGVIND